MFSALLLLAASPLPFGYQSQANIAAGKELVRRFEAHQFAEWVVKVPGSTWGAAVSAKARELYAEIQKSPSAALLAYEDAGDFYASKKAFVVAATECRIRTKEWAWSVDEKLNKEANQDATLQATKKALNRLELDTGDAFWTYSLYSHVGRVIGKDRVAGCRALATMPFMRVLDRYEVGSLKSLPRP